MKLKAVLFDYDGTLVDSEEVHYRLWKSVLKEYAVRLTENEYKSYHAGIPTSRNAQVFIDRYGIKVQADEIVKRKNVVTQMYLANKAFSLMPYAREALRLFRDNGVVLAMVTGAGPDLVNATMNVHGLREQFSVVITAADVRESKPSPDCYRLALAKLEMKPENCIALEDSENGIRSAVSAGIPCLGIRHVYSESHNFSGATAVFSNLKNATEWIVKTCTFVKEENAAVY